jgi:hypothetical protein
MGPGRNNVLVQDMHAVECYIEGRVILISLYNERTVKEIIEQILLRLRIVGIEVDKNGVAAYQAPGI